MLQSKHKAEKMKDELRRLSQKGGNKLCFDCGARAPLYLVIDYHVLVCSNCGGIHRSLQHKVKGITMCEFSEEEVRGLATCGNDRARCIWLARFTGRNPISGVDSAIRNHLVRVFDQQTYISMPEFKSLQADLEEARHPHPEPTAARPIAPPPANAPPPPQQVQQRAQPAPAPTVTAHLAPAPAPSKSAPPADDLFDDFFAAPPAAPQAPVTANSIANDLFAGAPPPQPPAPSFYTANMPGNQAPQSNYQGQPPFYGSGAPQPMQQSPPPFNGATQYHPAAQQQQPYPPQSYNQGQPPYANNSAPQSYPQGSPSYYNNGAQQPYSNQPTHQATPQHYQGQPQFNGAFHPYGNSQAPSYANQSYNQGISPSYNQGQSPNFFNSGAPQHGAPPYEQHKSGITVLSITRPGEQPPPREGYDHRGDAGGKKQGPRPEDAVFAALDPFKDVK